MQQPQTLNITVGTDVVLHDRLMFDGETFDPALSTGIAANLVSSLGKRTALEVEVADGGLIIYVPWQERNAGYYGLEVTGTCNSKKWATYADSLIHYTRATEMGVAEVTIESDYYDITQVVAYRYSTSPIDKVTATVDNEVGTPNVDANYDGKNLSFAFHDLKGETGQQGIQGIQGVKGDTAVYNPDDPSSPDFVMANEMGDSTTKAMTQKAITDELMNERVCQTYEIDLSKGTIDKYYINADGDWAAGSSVSSNSRLYFEVNEGDTFKIEADNYFEVEFLTSIDTNSAPSYATASRIGNIDALSTPGVYWFTAPAGTKYMYLRNNTSSSSRLPKHIYKCVFTKEIIARDSSAYEDKFIKEEEVDLTSLTASRYYINADGDWARAANDSNMGIVVFSAGEELRMEIDGWVEVEFLSSFSNIDVGDTASIVGTRIGFINGVGAPGIYYLTIPHGTRYIYMRSKSGGDTRLPKRMWLRHYVKDSAPSSDLYLGTLVQKGLTAEGLSDSTTRVSMADCMAIPYPGATLTMTLPYGYLVGIRSGNKADDLSTNNYWYGDGDTYTFPAASRFFRLCFCKFGGYSNNTNGTYLDVTLSEVNALIASGDIAITLPEEDSIITQNSESEKYVKAMMRSFVPGISDDRNKALTTYPVFCHTSDIHGDATRFNRYLDYCDFLCVDAALVSGDFVAVKPVSGAQYVNDGADTHNTLVLTCMGNHDARALTEQQEHDQIIGYLIDKNQSTAPETNPTYYYHDIADKQIRVISLNLYEAPRDGDKVNFSQAQCEFFISALASTPQGYGVIVMMHAPETIPDIPTGNASFSQQTLNYTTTMTNITGTPIAKIVDAFIGKSAVSVTYLIGSTSITVNADFTNVASGVEFIAYVNGHLHADRIGYIPGTEHMQLNLNVTCCSSVYGTDYPNYANLSDTPRGGKGATQDCFNVYTIDRTNKVVRVSRVGANVSITGERKFMTIAYSE